MTDPTGEVEHVIVLMFENRSFDHMLGLLRPGDRSYGGVEVDDERFSNPVDPDRPDSERVRVSDAADFELPLDTPHSHLAAMDQMQPAGEGPLTMTGFISSYRKKILDPHASRPDIRWVNIGVAGSVVVVVLTAVMSLPLVVPRVVGPLILVGAVAAAIHQIERRTPVLPTHLWRKWFGGALGVALLLGMVSTATAMIDRWPLRAGANALAIVAGGVAAWGWRNRQRKPSPPGDPDIARRIMACMARDKAPALWRLAENFAVCTAWYSSVPGATWPNRNFAHAGTSDGTVDIEVGLYEDDTIFTRLDEAGRSWRIYRDRDSLAQVMAFGELLDGDNIHNWSTFEKFAEHVAAEANGTGTLATYSFIEPCHDGIRSNSQHPGNNDHDRSPDSNELTDFERGEQLLIDVYETLRTHPGVFQKTVLVVTYDEHGGLYDHEAPPEDAVPPRRELHSEGRTPRSWLPRCIRRFVQQPLDDFDFQTLGPRVPTVIISPRIPARPDPTTYDHAAIPATIRKLFAPGTAQLSDREARSPTFDHLWAGSTARTDLPVLEDLRFTPEPFVGLADAGPAHTSEHKTDLNEELEKLAPEIAVRLTAGRDQGFGPLADAAPATLTPTEVARLFTSLAEESR